jgi:hypothetical protein
MKESKGKNTCCIFPLHVNKTNAFFLPCSITKNTSLNFFIEKDLLDLDHQHLIKLYLRSYCSSTANIVILRRLLTQTYVNNS